MPKNLPGHWLVFLIGPLGMLFGEDQRANIMKTRV